MSELYKRKRFFGKSLAQQKRDKAILKEKLKDAVQFGNEIGLKPLFTFVDSNETDLEADDFKVHLIKEEEKNEKEKKALFAKDLAFLSDNNYVIFRNMSGLKLVLPSLYQIKLLRNDLNGIFPLMENRTGTEYI